MGAGSQHPRRRWLRDRNAGSDGPRTACCHLPGDRRARRSDRPVQPGGTATDPGPAAFSAARQQPTQLRVRRHPGVRRHQPCLRTGCRRCRAARRRRTPAQADLAAGSGWPCTGRSVPAGSARQRADADPLPGHAAADDALAHTGGIPGHVDTVAGLDRGRGMRERHECRTADRIGPAGLPAVAAGRRSAPLRGDGRQPCPGRC